MLSKSITELYNRYQKIIDVGTFRGWSTYRPVASYERWPTGPYGMEHMNQLQATKVVHWPRIDKYILNRSSIERNAALTTIKGKI